VACGEGDGGASPWDKKKKGGLKALKVISGARRDDEESDWKKRQREASAIE